MKFQKTISFTAFLVIAASNLAADTSSFEGLYKPRGEVFAHWDCKNVGEDGGALSISENRVTLIEESCGLANPTASSEPSAVSFDAYCAVEGSEYEMQITLSKTDFGVIFSGDGFSAEWESCELSDILTGNETAEYAEQEQFRQAVAAMDAGEITRAIELFTPLADAGDSTAQFNIGLIYRFESYGSPDLERALYWLRMAAEQGVSDAQFYLGEFYHRGQVVNQDFGLAMEWYIKAAGQENGKAQANIGFMHERGQGVDVDLNEARNWYQQGADNGNDAAIAWLRDNLPLSNEHEEKTAVLEWEGPARDFLTALANKVINREMSDRSWMDIFGADGVTVINFRERNKQAGMTAEGLVPCLRETYIIDSVTDEISSEILKSGFNEMEWANWVSLTLMDSSDLFDEPLKSEVAMVLRLGLVDVALCILAY